MESHPALCIRFLAFSLVLWAAPCGAQSAEPSDSIPLKQSVPDEAGTDADANDASGEGAPVVGDRSAEAQPAAPEPAAPRTVKVHIESGSRVNLERVTPEGKWVVVCESPCDKELSVEETYRINAKGKVPSSSFRLTERPEGGATLAVNTASSVLRTIGGTSIVVGALPASGAAVLFVGGAIVIGVVVILACPIVAAFGGSFENCAGFLFGESATAYWDFISQTPVWGTIVGGVALSGGGLVLLGTNKRTRVKQGGTDLALLHDPRAAQLELPQIVSFPLLSGEF